MTAKRKAAATAVADVTEGLILARVEITASPERVFRALTTDELTRWWGAVEGYRTTAFTIDLRPGGAWRSEGKGADGRAFHVEGEVIEVDPPRKLVQTWRPSWESGPATTITYTLDAIDGGTRVTLRHTGFTNAQACEGHSDGWTRVLGWLGAHLDAASDERFYLLRLIPPRPTFAQDMSADERAMMAEHAAYWKGKLSDGVVLAFGQSPIRRGPGGSASCVLATKRRSMRSSAAIRRSWQTVDLATR
jgi:uncharacterized protein YndB with AHSA1/START domain